ncbi:MAG: helix-turn-helix domain-containing protein [Chryseolinea sp.]
MQVSNTTDSDFISQVTAIVEQNISDEQFGVTELAAEVNMSRSNLLRKVKKLTNLSVSQLIRQVRLSRAMNLLRTSSLNVSEVSDKVGFGSTSYFIKCFREHYGYPPGEAGKKALAEAPAMPGPSTPERRTHSNVKVVTIAALFIVALAAGRFAYRHFEAPTSELKKEKSVAVLPFINDSNDSTNVYFINGLMESTLNNLQKIEDLKVISRTSTEKYRKTTKSIPEMARELNVNYFVEGSGQKVGDQILLNIQLIDASTARHLWSRQYKREVKDIFALQQEIAKNIAAEIEAIITPEEKRQIEKNPTDDLVAYDYYLQGRHLYAIGGQSNLEASIVYFKQAISQDKDFALAYADAAIVFYYLDIFHIKKKYEAELNSYADKALLLDSKSANSLVAKAVYYMHRKEYLLAVPFLEKALEYNPNSALVINFLSEVYNNYLPNTEKYLEYALLGARLDVSAYDSATTSYNYLHLANALMQTGFVDDAILNIDKSLAYNPKNPYSSWVKILFLYGRKREYESTMKQLIAALKKDSTNLHIVEEIGKLLYMKRDYVRAYPYYRRFLELRDLYQLDVFKHENLKIAFVLSKMGYKEEAKVFAKSFKEFADNEKSIYKNLNLAGYYSYRGDIEKAVAHMKLFAREDNFQYWILLIEEDPLVEPLKEHPEFQNIIKSIKFKFWNNHERLKLSLKEKELL